MTYKVPFVGSRSNQFWKSEEVLGMKKLLNFDNPKELKRQKPLICFN